LKFDPTSAPIAADSSRSPTLSRKQAYVTGIVAVELDVENAITSASRIPSNTRVGLAQQPYRIRTKYQTACSKRPITTAAMNQITLTTGSNPWLPTVWATVPSTASGTRSSTQCKITTIALNDREMN